MIMMGSLELRKDCRIEREEQVEYRGTRKNIVHQGNGWRYHGQSGSR